MTSHHQPHLVIDNTHRAILLPPEFAEHLQVEPDTPIVFTGAEVIFGFFLGGLIGSLITCGLAWVIAEFAL